MGKSSERVDPGGTHQAVACVTFSALRRLDGGARGEVLPPTHRGVSGDRARAGRARRPRSFERRRRSELFFSFSVEQAPGAAARALSALVAKNRKRRIREKPKMEPLGFVTQEIVHRVTESDFRVERSSRFVTRRNDVFFPTDAKEYLLSRPFEGVGRSPELQAQFFGFRSSFRVSFFLSGAAREPARFFRTRFFFSRRAPFDEPDVASASAEAPPLSRETRVVSRAPE
jgi:hypothetical protein